MRIYIQNLKNLKILFALLLVSNGVVEDKGEDAMCKKLKKSTKKSVKKWSVGRRFAFLALVALWSAGIYALIWLLISHFVSADLVSHYYADLNMSRWWGALFVPIYFVLIAVLYLFVLPISKYNCLLFVPLLAGLICGIMTTFASSLDVFYNTQHDVVYFFGMCAIVAGFISFIFEILFKKCSITKFVCFFLAALILGFVTGVCILYASPVQYVSLFIMALCISTVGFIAGILLGILLALLVAGVIRLHRIAFGLPAKKDKDNEEE